MKIVTTRRAAYGIRAAIHMAECAPEWVKAGDIAEATEVSTGFLQQILQALQRGGLVTSRPSRAGGYALTRRPVDISVLDVIETLEGPLDAGECAFRGEPCEWGEICAVHEVWSAGQAAFRASLRSVTVADMASVAELEVCDYES